MKERKSTTIKKRRALNDLVMAGGNVTKACERAGIVRSTFYKWQEDDLQFATNVESIIGGIVSYAQDQLMLTTIQGTPEFWARKLNDAQNKLGHLQNKHLQIPYNDEK